MNNVAFVTYEKTPQLSNDDRLAAGLLEADGAAVHAAVWDDSRVDWSQFDCVVIRSPWDYHLKPERYAEWLQQRAAENSNLWNPPHAVLANLNKRYLVDLAARGVEIVPTIYLPGARRSSLRNALLRNGWDQAVVKPAISAGAHQTWRTSLTRADDDQARFEQQLAGQDVLVQRYMDEVQTQGEWSLMFFAGEYSHAVLKRPAQDDFRVQQHLGGATMAAAPPRTIVDDAYGILAHVGSELLYARIDGVEREGRLVLMELEINEPFLFLGYDVAAARRFAAAIKRAL